MFTALRRSERCVRDLVETEGLPQPLVSHHLGALVAAGLVQCRRSDGFNMYAVDPEGLATAARAVFGVLDPDHLTPVALPGGNTRCCRDTGTS